MGGEWLLTLVCRGDREKADCVRVCGFFFFFFFLVVMCVFGLHLVLCGSLSFSLSACGTDISTTLAFGVSSLYLLSKHSC